MPIPRPSDLFDGTPVEQVTQFEALKNVVKGVIAEHDHWRSTGEVEFIPKVGIVKRGSAAIEDTMLKAGIAPDVVKEWTLSNPIPSTAIQPTGLTPYNVEPAVLMIVPKELKLRNTVSRTKGIGQGLEYRRVTGVSNSTAANVQNPFFSSNVNTASFNGVTLNRPNLISYSGDIYFKPYVEMGFSDSVSQQTQYASQGFTEAEALSKLALIWAHTLGEERMLLSSRSTALPIAGATASSAAVAGSTGLPAVTSGAVLVTFSSSFGESQAISGGTVTLTAGQGITLTLANVPAGTIAVNTYITTTGPMYWKGTTQLTTGASPSTFATVTALPSTAADNGSYGNYQFGGVLNSGATANSAFAYDGLITEFSNSAIAGYTKSLNAALSTSNPGVEFENALSTIYTSQGGDPDEIWTTGSITQAMWDAIKSQGTSGGYRVNLVTGDNGITVGGAVTGITNPLTSRQVNFSTHRYMPAGVAVIHSTQVPWPDSNVQATVKVSNVIDTQVIDWTQIGFSRDASTYTYGTMVCEAPVLSGTLLNINN